MSILYIALILSLTQVTSKWMSRGFCWQFFVINLSTGHSTDAMITSG